MASVTGFTAERMLEIEASCIVDGDVVGDNLILTKHDASTIDAGSVRGPTGVPGVSNAQLDAWMADNVPICTIVDYMGVAAPSAKWLTMAGQTVVNAQTLYPAWWAKLPAGMKSGANAIMPDTRGRVSVGLDVTQTEFDTLNETGGEKSHQLSQAELPNVSLSINPPATGVTGTTANEAGHIHPLNLNSTNGLDDNQMVTGLTPSQGGGFITQSAGGPHGLMITAGSGVTIRQDDYTSPVYPDLTHYHNVSGNTSNGSAHAHGAGTLAVDIPPFPSPALGSGTPHNNLQPYVVFLKIVKVL